MLNLTGGQSNVASGTGNNIFTAGTGSLDVSGGGGMDTYIYHTSSGTLGIEDSSAAKGDKLILDRGLQSSMKQASDGVGGIMISFGAGSGHSVDIHGLAALPSSSVT